MAHEVNQSERDVAAQVRSALVSRISSERLELWIPPDTTWDFQQGVLTLGFELEFACQLCNRMFRGELMRALAAVVGSPNVEVQFVVRAEPTMNPSQPKANSAAPVLNRADSVTGGLRSDSPRPKLTGSARASNPTHHASPANPAPRDFVAPAVVAAAQSATQPSPPLWQTVIAGESNQLAWTAINMVASEPGRITPVLMHGPTGTGKSLILAALAQRMRTELRLRRVVHLTSEQFTNDFTEGLQGGGLPMFRRKYRDVDAFLLDDIQFLMGKRSTLAEVRHTVDNLLRSGKQVVLSADRPLTELNGLGEEFSGQLRGGLVAPLFPLDESIRGQLLKKLADNAGVNLDDCVVRQLAERVSGDGRLIRGLIHRLTAVSMMQRGCLTWEQCWSSIMDLVQATKPVIRMADIERVVCGMFGLESDSLQSKSKIRSVSQPRMLAMFLARKYTPAAYKEIGDYFGQRRHSTVISAEKTVSAWLDENAQLEGNRSLTVRDAIRHVEAQLQVG